MKAIDDRNPSKRSMTASGEAHSTLVTGRNLVTGQAPTQPAIDRPAAHILSTSLCKRGSPEDTEAKTLCLTRT